MAVGVKDRREIGPPGQAQAPAAAGSRAGAAVSIRM